MNSHRILYWIAKNEYSFKSILFVCFIKAINSLFSYDGEPSVSKGIMSQLPSSHLFIHRVLAKLSNRVMPYGGNSRQLQLLFVFDFYWPSRSTRYWLISGRFTLFLQVSLVANVVHFILHRYRVSFQNPARFQKYLEPSKGLESSLFCLFSYAAIASCFIGRFMSFIIFFGS